MNEINFQNKYHGLSVCRDDCGSGQDDVARQGGQEHENGSDEHFRAVRRSLVHDYNDKKALPRLKVAHGSTSGGDDERNR